MTAISLRIEHLDELRANFAKAPQTSLKYLSLATRAAIFEVEKQAIDKNFQFKTPRSFRTGFLSLSFAYGRNFSPSGLSGSVGPTAHYAPYVYLGTRRGIRPNPFMDRIAGAAEPAVNKHFETAVDQIATALANV